jgi:hypothetical protein
LASQAVASFTLGKPVPVINPAEAVVHFPTWLWLGGGWSAQSATATDPTGLLSATVTATPTRVLWTMGEGQPVTCLGPGAPYRLDLPPESQHSDCMFSYVDSSVAQPNESYQATVTVFYHAGWAATDGTGGDLGVPASSASFAVRVAQVQTVNDG